MKPYVADPDFTLYVGDVRTVLAELAPESVHCVVTSPPYWGLRDYGTAAWDGGDADCAHRVGGQVQDTKAKGAITAGVRPGVDASHCLDCGAVRVDQQIGLEPTPEGFVASMLEVFREVRRVLRADGTCWLNLGDSYANDTKWGGSTGGKHATSLHGESGVGRRKVKTGIKQKDMVGIPWKVAFALQADGWYLRADIIWSKPNPMPESVTDRPTKAHEYLFLLTKSARYFYDQDAIRESAVGPNRGAGVTRGVNGPHAEARDRVRRTAAVARRTPLIPDQTKEGVGRQGLDSETFGQWSEDGGRNRRSVWEVATEAFAEAHFATFPQALVEPCVKAGTSECGVCPECGAPWARIVERVTKTGSYHDHGADGVEGMSQDQPANLRGGDFYRDYVAPKTVGWQPRCEHVDRPPVSATVLDPFIGSGTTALVARRLGRRSVGVELNPEYADLAARRLSQLSLLTPSAPCDTVSKSPKE